MAVVIPFAPHLRPAAGTTPRAVAADILFFTGIRYDRQVEAEPREAVLAPPAKRRSAPRPRRVKSAGQPV